MNPIVREAHDMIAGWKEEGTRAALEGERESHSLFYGLATGGETILVILMKRIEELEEEADKLYGILDDMPVDIEDLLR